MARGQVNAEIKSRGITGGDIGVEEEGAGAEEEEEEEEEEEAEEEDEETLAETDFKC